MARAMRRIRPGDPYPDRHAFRLAELVDETWHGTHGTGNLEVPVSTIAALTLLHPPDAERDEVAGLWMDLSPEQFGEGIRGVWRWYALKRPDLLNPVWPLMEVWLGEKALDRFQLRAAKKVADVVLSNDLIGLTGTDSRRDTDVLGAVLTALRPKSARSARGQFYTPSPVCDLIAAMTLGTDSTRQSFYEPAVGTGGMFRAAAMALRHKGISPRTAEWVAVDIDHIAIACLAVNVLQWGLGYKVLLGVGDALADNWWDRAVKMRRETLEIHARMRDALMISEALRTVLDLTTRANSPNTRDDAPAATTEPVTEEPLADGPAPAAAADPDVSADDGDFAEDDTDRPVAVASEFTGDFWDLVDAVSQQRSSA